MVKIDRFYITADRYNVILQEEKTKINGDNKGEKYMENLGYYKDLVGAVLGAYQILVRESIAKPKAVDVETQIKKIERIKKHLEKEMSDIKWEN